jgi:hypothetical protein
MDPLSIIGYAVQALDLVPKIVAAGQDIAGYIAKTTSVINAAHAANTAIPDAAWDELKATREALQKDLHS